MEHKCIGYSGGIFWRQDGVVKPAGWYMDGYVPPINYCPYCGLKLGPPDVKIEVSRKWLAACAEQLDAAMMQGLSLHYGDAGWSVITGIVGSIQGLLND